MQESKNQKKALFFHFRNEDSKLTISANVDRTNMRLQIGVFDFNEKQQQFCKRIGRNAALGRATKKPSKVIYYTVNDNPYNIFIEEAKSIVQNTFILKNDTN